MAQGFRTTDGGPVPAAFRAGLELHPGYQPTYVYREPPLSYAATNMVFSTFGPMPFDVSGPGTIPLGIREISSKPTWIGAAYIKNGIPTSTGTVVMTPPTFMPHFDQPISHMY